MAATSRRIGISGSESMDSQSDSVTLHYEVEYDTAPTNFYDALQLARSASGTPVPARRSLYSSPSAILLANAFSATIDWKSDKRSTLWKWAVTFSPPPQGDGNGEASIHENPLERPPIFNIQYMDVEEVLTEARNVEYLARGDGTGSARAIGTLGPIVNAAGIRPDEPIMRTKRQAVIVIQKNFPTLAAITERNDEYEDSTNDGTVHGYTIRKLEYQLTESLGMQVENGYTFWPGVTSILIKKSTDLKLDNVGYQYWTVPDGELVRAKDSEGDFTAEPVNLTVAGALSTDGPHPLTWRHLTEKNYAPLFE